MPRPTSLTNFDLITFWASHHTHTSYSTTTLTMSARTDVEAEENQSATVSTPETLSAKLSHKLEVEHVDIQDLSGTGTKKAEI